MLPIPVPTIAAIDVHVAVVHFDLTPVYRLDQVHVFTQARGQFCRDLLIEHVAGAAIPVQLVHRVR